MPRAHLLQAEDSAGQRRNVGASTSDGSGALRVVSPDLQAAVDATTAEVKSTRVSNAQRLDDLLTELGKKLAAGDLARDDLQRLQVVVETMPGGLAQETTLESVDARLSALLTELEGKADLAETQPVKLDPAASHYVTDSGSRLVQNGQVFACGKELSISSGSTGSWTLTNPDTSGVLLVVSKLRVYADGTGPLRFRQGATVDASADALTPRNLSLASANASAATFLQGVDVVSGGTVWDVETRVVPEAPYRFSGRADLAPGTSMSLTFDAGGLASSRAVAATVVWAEVAL